MRLSCYEFRHNIVKVAMDPRGDGRVYPQTTLTMLWRNSLSITGQTHEILEICKQTFDGIINDSGDRLCSLVQQRGPSQYALRRTKRFSVFGSEMQDGKMHEQFYH